MQIKGRSTLWMSLIVSKYCSFCPLGPLRWPRFGCMLVHIISFVKPPDRCCWFWKNLWVASLPSDVCKD